jgi:DNA-binding MarR family transcriptional regulator
LFRQTVIVHLVDTLMAAPLAPAPVPVAPAAGPSAAPTSVEPLDAEEAELWRAMARMVLALPRLLEAELRDAHGLMPSEYMVLSHLSEQPNRAMRMSELAEMGTLSGSGMTRVVERLVSDGLVERIRCREDARGQFAVLTDQGLARLEAAFPEHLLGVRRHVLDHLTGLDTKLLTEAFARIAAEEQLPFPRRRD